MKTHRFLRLAVAFGFFTVPALADAPPDQYSPFTESSTTIADAFTKLDWQRAAARVGQRYALAEATCQTAGLRLPTVKELLTLVDEAPHDEYQGTSLVALFIDRSAFGNTPGNPLTPINAPYWTQTPASNGHWTVDFATGKSAPADDAVAKNVRCVIDAPP